MAADYGVVLTHVNTDTSRQLEGSVQSARSAREIRIFPRFHGNRDWMRQATSPMIRFPSRDK